MKGLNELGHLHSLLEFVADKIDWNDELDFEGVSKKKKAQLKKKLEKSIGDLESAIEEINNA